MLVTGVVRHESFISLYVLLVQMLVEHNGFDFEYIKSSISKLWNDEYNKTYSFDQFSISLYSL